MTLALSSMFVFWQKVASPQESLLQLRVSDDVCGGPGIEPSAHPGQVLQHILLEVALLGEPVGDVQIIGLRGRFESKQASINDGIT